MSAPLLLTLREAAEVTGVSVSRLRAAANSGELAHVRFGPRGRFLLREAAVREWLGNHTRPSRHPALAVDVVAPLTVEQLLPTRRRFS